VTKSNGRSRKTANQNFKLMVTNWRRSKILIFAEKRLQAEEKTIYKDRNIMDQAKDRQRSTDASFQKENQITKYQVSEFRWRSYNQSLEILRMKSR